MARNHLCFTPTSRYITTSLKPYLPRSMFSTGTSVLQLTMMYLQALDRHPPQRMCPLRESKLPVLPSRPPSRWWAPMGPSTEGPQCHMLILRNYHVSCHYFCNFPVNVKVVPYTISFFRIILCHATYFNQTWLGSM